MNTFLFVSVFVSCMLVNEKLLNKFIKKYRRIQDVFCTFKSIFSLHDYRCYRCSSVMPPVVTIVTAVSPSGFPLRLRGTLFLDFVSFSPSQ